MRYYWVIGHTPMAAVDIYVVASSYLVGVVAVYCLLVVPTPRSNKY
jgi:hypothetical protein